MRRLITASLALLFFICIASVFSMLFDRDLYEAIAPMALTLAVLNQHVISEMKDKKREDV